MNLFNAEAVAKDLLTTVEHYAQQVGSYESTAEQQPKWGAEGCAEWAAIEDRIYTLGDEQRPEEILAVIRRLAAHLARDHHGLALFGGNDRFLSDVITLLVTAAAMSMKWEIHG